MEKSGVTPHCLYLDLFLLDEIRNLEVSIPDVGFSFDNSYFQICLTFYSVNYSRRVVFISNIRSCQIF